MYVILSTHCRYSHLTIAAKQYCYCLCVLYYNIVDLSIPLSMQPFYVSKILYCVELIFYIAEEFKWNPSLYILEGPNF